MQLLSAAAHHKPQLVVAHLPGIMPILYNQAKVDPSMVREVDLGPFKHKIDDGLELRKAAFECMGVLLDACPSRIDSSAHLRLLESGLQVDPCCCNQAAGNRMVTLSAGGLM